MQTLSEGDFFKDEHDSEEDIAIMTESVLVLSDKESDEDPKEKERAKSKLNSESPLKTFIDRFKEKYNIAVEPNDIAIFV